jgi:hypothetical protein
VDASDAVESHYLRLLPIRRAEAEADGRSYARQPIRLAAVVGAIALLCISSVVPIAFVRLVANPQNDVLPGWPASGCLDSSLEPLGAQVVVTQASLCSVDRTIRARVVLENLEPNARYIVWVAYFANRSLLEDQAKPVTVHGVVETRADARGVFHVDAPVRTISLAPHSYVWLIVAQPQWSPVSHPSYRSIDADTGRPEARAVFVVP